MTPKNLWIQNVVESLKQIASEEFQIKGWVKNEIHDYCTFLETKCGFLMDDDIEGFLEHAKEFGLSDVQIKKIDAVRIAFEEYADIHWGFGDPVFIVKDPKWHSIRDLAKEALVSLGITRYLDPSKSILKDSLLTYIMWLSKPFERSLKEADANTAQLNHFEYLRNCFFGSKVENIIANYKDYEISDDQVKKLKELYEYFKNYQEKDRDKHDYKKILDDSEWDHIQNLAKEVVALFNYKQFPDEDNIVSEA
jgi:hypothetical protein